MRTNPDLSDHYFIPRFHRSNRPICTAVKLQCRVFVKMQCRVFVKMQCRVFVESAIRECYSRVQTKLLRMCAPMTFSTLSTRIFLSSSSGF